MLYTRSCYLHTKAVNIHTMSILEFFYGKLPTMCLTVFKLSFKSMGHSCFKQAFGGGEGCGEKENRKLYCENPYLKKLGWLTSSPLPGHQSQWDELFGPHLLCKFVCSCLSTLAFFSMVHCALIACFQLISPSLVCCEFSIALGQELYS